MKRAETKWILSPRSTLTRSSYRLYCFPVESNWPAALSQLLELSSQKSSDRVAVRQRFTTLLLPCTELLAGKTIIKVAGTNGKGSVCAMLEACLRREGQRTGLFTSPHLSRITERFRVNGKDVSLETIDRHAGEVLRQALAIIKRYGAFYTPAFFEALILIAIRIFNEENVRVAIFEAGVGGYSDALSLLYSPLAVMTSLGLDHQDQLGDSLEEIAADKAGIASAETQLILAPDIAPTLRAIIETDARKRGIQVTQATTTGLRATLHGLQQPMQVELLSEGQKLIYQLPLLGKYQLNNFATVVETLRVMRMSGAISGLDCLAGVEQARWPGRLEFHPGPPSYIIDAAHNEHGLRALIEALDDLVPYEKRVLLYGISLGKDYSLCLPLLPRLAPLIYLVDGFYRAERASVIEPLLPPGGHCAKTFSSPTEAVSFFATDANARARVIIGAGSIFMIGELRECLAAQKPGAEVEVF